MLFIITWAVTLISLYIGYIVGQKSMSEKPLLKIPSIKRLFSKKPVLGAIQKISQKEINKKGTRLEATEQAMEETLDKELNL